MLVLPMSSSSSNTGHAGAISPYPPRAQREESPQTLELRKKVASTVLSAVSPSSSPNPKRPKLSLQTSLGPSQPFAAGRTSFSTDRSESLTAQNTTANAFEVPPPTPSSAVTSKTALPMMTPTITLSPTAASSNDHTSLLSSEEPYSLPLGTHSILRNSPLTKPHLFATSARTSRRMFPPRKEVKFSEGPEDFAPTPVFETLDGEDDDISISEEQREERRRAIQQEDGHSTVGHRRRRKKREWIWRPLDDDILLEHGQADTYLRG